MFEVNVSAGGLPEVYQVREREVSRRSAGSVPSSRALKITNNYYQRKKKSSIHTLWAKSAQLLFKVKFISRNRPLINWGDEVDWHFMPLSVHIM